MNESSLEARIRRLEDIEALKQLKHRYCTLCDDGYVADPLAALFAEDAVWDGGPLGRFEGREAIRAFFAGCSKVVSFAIHHVTNPVIEVDGDRATGDWLLWEPIVFARGERAVWMAARYHDRYRRIGGEWRFEHVAIDLRVLSPYERGFAQVRVAALEDLG
jgi:ketosteroid isomerase-like protein